MVNFNFEFFFIVKGIDAQMSLILKIPLGFTSENAEVEILEFFEFLFAKVMWFFGLGIQEICKNI